MNDASHSAAIEHILFLDAPHFCCGVILVDDRVLRAAPIVRYMVGWQRRRVERVCQARGWRVEEVISIGGNDEFTGNT